MKNRLLSLICVVALVVTMISTGVITVSAAAGDTFVHFDGMKADEWTADEESMGLIKDDGTISLVGSSDTAAAGEHWYTHKNTFNSAEHFEFTAKHNNTAADGYTAVAVGDLTFAFILDKNDKGAVNFTNDGKLYFVVRLGDAIIYAIEAADWEESTNQWIIPKIDNFGVVYDNGVVSAYYVRTGSAANSPIITNLDLSTIEGWDSTYNTLNKTVRVGAYCWWQKSTVFSGFSLTGITPADVTPDEPVEPEIPEEPVEPEIPEEPVEPEDPSMEPTAGDPFNFFTGINATDWTASNAELELIKEDGTIVYANAATDVLKVEHWYTNKNIFDSLNYFEFTAKHSNTAADGYTGIAVGDLTILFALDKNDKGAIDIANNGSLYLIVKMGDDVIYTIEAADWEESTTQWIIPKIDNFGVVYDNGKLTAYYVRTGSGSNSPIVTDLDLTALKGWDDSYTTLNQTVKVGAYCWYQSSTVFSNYSLSGVTPIYPDDNDIPDLSDMPGGSCGENAVWGFDAETGTLYIDGTGAMDDYINVGKVAPWRAEHRAQITKVVIGDDITYIGNRAFKGHNKITSVTFGKSIQSIGYECFYGCTKLEKIHLNEGLTKISSLTFYNCSSLKQITIPSTVTKLSNRAFKGTGLTSVVVPDTVTNMGYEVFMNCASLESVDFTEGVSMLQPCTFMNCTSLTSFVFTDNMCRIRTNAFTGCTALESVYFEDETKMWGSSDKSDAKIASNSFEGCNENLELIATKGSHVESYAAKHGFTFVDKEAYDLENSGYTEIFKTDTATIAIEGKNAVAGAIETAKIYDEATGESASAFKRGDLGYFSVDLKTADVYGVAKVAICKSSGSVITSMDFKITSQATNTCLRFTATGEEAYVTITLKDGSASKILFANPEFYHSTASEFTFVRSGYYMEDDGSWKKTQISYADYYTSSALPSQLDRCHDILINGNYLFAISASNKTFYSFDISNPTKPVYLDSINRLGSIRQMEFTSDKKGIVIVARTSQTYIIDVTDPADLKKAGRIDNLELATGVDVSGNYCAIADRTHGVTIFDISDIYNPVGISNAPTGETQDVDIYGNYIYCGIWGDRCIKVIDITDIDNPVVLTDLQRSLGGRGDGVTIRDGYLYAATGQHDGAATSTGGYIGSGFEIWDVRDPKNPVHVSTARMDGMWAGTPDIWKIEISGNLAYVCGSYNGVYIYDISNKYNPIRLEQIEIVAKPGDSRYSPITNANVYPYPFDTTAEVHSPIYNIACIEGYMYLAGSTAGLFVYETDYAHPIDEKDSAAPNDLYDGSYYDVDFNSFGWKEVQTFDTEGSQAWAVATNGNYLYVASGTKGIRVLDKSMKQIYRYDTLDITMDVKIAGNVLVTAECDGGIAVYTINEDGSLTFESTTNTNKTKFNRADGTRQIEISPNGMYVLAYSNAYVTLYNISNKAEIGSELCENRSMIYQRFIGFGVSTVVNSDGTHTDYMVAYMGNSGKGMIIEFDREEGTYRIFNWKLGLANNRGLCAYGDKMFASIDSNTIAMFSPAEIVAKYGKEGGVIETSLANMPEVKKFSLSGKSGAIGPVSVANGYLFIQGGQVSNLRVVDISDLSGNSLSVVTAVNTNAMAGYAIEFNGKTVMAMGYAGVVSFNVA